MGEFALRRFLETLCFAYMKINEKNGYLNENNVSYTDKALSVEQKDTIKDKHLFFDCGSEPQEKKLFRDDLMRGDFTITSAHVDRERSFAFDTPDGKREDGRFDIFIRLSVSRNRDVKKESRVAILIENKIKSAETDSQTMRYIQYLVTSPEMAEFDYFIPVFLYPVSNDELADDVKKMAKKESKKPSKKPCENKLFLLLNYQYLVDGVIVPCLTQFGDGDIGSLLRDYVTCLSKSINVNEEKYTDSLVMAVGPEERQLSLELWEGHQEIMLCACEELQQGDVDEASVEPFLTRRPEDVAFFRSVLSPILHHLSGEPENNKIIDYIKRAISVNVGPGYWVMQANGIPWQFISGKRDSKALGALGWVLLHEYTSKNKITVEQLQNMLSSIRHKWLRTILLTEKEFMDLLDRWLIARQSTASPVCKYINAVCDKDHCPLYPGRTSFAQVNSYGQKEPECLYIACDHFYLGKVKDTLDIMADKLIADEFFSEIRYSNTTFGPLKLADQKVFVARYWGKSTLDQLIEILKLSQYVTEDRQTAYSLGKLSFNIEDIICRQ